MEHVRIFALEKSCDETAAAVIEDGRKILSNAVFSQIDMHALYGGVVPEIASRAHVEACDRMIDQALQEAGMTADQLDACAVTYGPGLVGALLTGVSCMKGFSYAIGKPLIPVNHIEGHVSANYLTHPDLEPPIAIWSRCRTTACITCWVKRWTTRRAKPLIRPHACWVCRIPAAPGSISWPRRATLMP